MQCVTDLVKLRDSVFSRSRYLRQITSQISSPHAAADRQILAYATIELDNLIVVGFRQYTKSSLLRSRTAGGVRITAAVHPNSSEEAAALIYQSLNPVGYQKAKSPATISERNEIVFRNPKDIEKVLTDYSASNLPNVKLAVSLNAAAFSEVKIFRHFFAHRAKNTFEECQKFSADSGIVGAYKPEYLTLLARPGTGVRFLDGWLADIENFFDLAT